MAMFVCLDICWHTKTARIWMKIGKKEADTLDYNVGCFLSRKMQVNPRGAASKLYEKLLTLTSVLFLLSI